MKQYIFFLGGHDAEMNAIKKILEQNNKIIFDNNLSWSNATLSSYKDDIKNLSDGDVPVFIELQLDCHYPENSIIIDHHNEKAGKDKKTSIEQIANLLGVPLNRQQKLISANDRGHINGMMDIHATDKEIYNIRALDRKAQGVTEHDEKKAEQSIEQKLEQIGSNAVIIESLTVKTSPIVDRLYDKYLHIFIYTPKGMLIYSGNGEMIDKLETHCKTIQKQGKGFQFFKGGELPVNGYFGSTLQIKKDKIIQMISEINSKTVKSNPKDKE